MRREAPAIVVILLFGCLCTTVSGDVNIRKLFSRHADKRLSSINAGYHENITVEACAADCNSETSFQCKSFTYDNTRRTCFLYTVNLYDRDVRLLDAIDVDYYETAYAQLFQRLPKHRIPPPTASRQPIEGVSSVEECARRCLLSPTDSCCGFNFRQITASSTCYLIIGSCYSVPAVRADDTDFYQRLPEGALSNFINYGMGILRPRESVNIYQRVINGITLEQCAQRCLNESTFHCASFDFVFTTPGSPASSAECRMSHFIAASVGGLVVDTVHPRHSHYELAERYLSHFFAVPYSLIPGNNVKTYTGVSPERCAELCVRDSGIVCRSFDYQMKSGSECNLSEKTGNDVGGLDINAGLLDSVHHFEMKPLLDCGGELAAETGELASPNWPRNYAHHQNCEWNITVSRNKIIKLEFNHLTLWGQTTSNPAPCTEKDDRLVIEEPNSNVKPFCASASSRTIVTRSNQLTVKFITNALGDAQGFRAFYSSDWPCDVNLQDSPGEIASPSWPDYYPANLRCTWRLTAPAGQRVRVHFTNFNLDRHKLGHCNERVDHVRLFDGGSASAPLIGIYCGRPFGMKPATVLSTSRDLLIQFQSDRHSLDVSSTSTAAPSAITNPAGDSRESEVWWRKGFHAVFSFEPTNATVFDDVDGPIDSSRYIDVGGRRGLSDSNSDGHDASDNHGVKGTSLELSHPGTAADQNTDGRSGLWAAVALLLVLLMLTGIALFLVVHHYRQKLMGQGEDVIEDQQAHVLEDIPLRTVHAVSVAVSSRRSQHFSNIVELPEPTTSCQSDDCMSAAAASPIYEQCGPPQPTRPVPRPRSTYGKYRAENAKNTNAESCAEESACANPYVSTP